MRTHRNAAHPDTPGAGDAALALAEQAWKVMPIFGKVPAIRSAHPMGDPLRRTCHGECGRPGHGFYDATDDPAIVSAMFVAFPGAGIGGTVPDRLLVLDTDPRNGGDRWLADLEAVHGPLPATLTVRSGRRDGGTHRYYQHPGGMLSGEQLVGSGVDLKQPGRGLVVFPPTVHAATGFPYEWADTRPPTQLPAWFVAKLRPKPRPVVRPIVRSRHATGDSPADWFCEAHTWADILQGYAPAPWQLVNGDGGSDGSGWRHPTATAAVSATVRHGLLFVYSSNTALPVTEPGARTASRSFERGRSLPVGPFRTLHAKRCDSGNGWCSHERSEHRPCCPCCPSCEVDSRRRGVDGTSRPARPPPCPFVAFPPTRHGTRSSPGSCTPTPSVTKCSTRPLG